MSPFTISREYGELIEGWRETRRLQQLAILAQDENETSRLAQESRDWADVMRRCPMFVRGFSA